MNNKALWILFFVENVILVGFFSYIMLTKAHCPPCDSILNRNIVLNKIFPGWIVKIYYDKTVPVEIINKLKIFNNTEVIEITNPNLLKGNIRGMFWRFLT